MFSGVDAASALRQHRRTILDIARKHGARNVRVFGSVARGTSGPESDLDLLIDLDPGRSLLDVIAIEQDIEDALGVKVQVATEGGLKPRVRDIILSEAVPV